MDKENGSQVDVDAEGGGQQPEKTFTQTEMDAIIRERLTRERQKYSDYDDLKNKAGQWAEHEEAQKSELQKALDAKSAAEAAMSKALLEANNRMIKAALVAEAGKHGAQHPDDAYRLVDLSTVNITDDGAITGAEEAVKALIESGRLPIVRRPSAPTLDAGAGNGEKSGDEAIQLSQEEMMTAQKMGLTFEQYQKGKVKK